MLGHLECFDEECFFIADDIWFPWSDIFMCRDGDYLCILEGVNAGEEVQITISDGRICLIGCGFEIIDVDRLKVDFRQGGLQ